MERCAVCGKPGTMVWRISREDIEEIDVTVCSSHSRPILAAVQGAQGDTFEAQSLTAVLEARITTLEELEHLKASGLA